MQVHLVAPQELDNSPTLRHLKHSGYPEVIDEGVGNDEARPRLRHQLTR